MQRTAIHGRRRTGTNAKSTNARRGTKSKTASRGRHRARKRKAKLELRDDIRHDWHDTSPKSQHPHHNLRTKGCKNASPSAMNRALRKTQKQTSDPTKGRSGRAKRKSKDEKTAEQKRDSGGRDKEEPKSKKRAHSDRVNRGQSPSVAWEQVSLQMVIAPGECLQPEGVGAGCSKCRQNGCRTWIPSWIGALQAH